MVRRISESKLPREIVLPIWGFEHLSRPFDKHINNEELDALVPSPSETGRQLHGLYPDAVREAELHVEVCADCAEKLSKYRQLANRFSNMVVSIAAPLAMDCPKSQDIDWHEVASGLWPEFKTTQLIMHAALCDHCGPLLRAATSVDDDPTPQEEVVLAQLKAPSRPVMEAQRDPIQTPGPPPVWRQFLQWKIVVPAAALMSIVVVLTSSRSSPARPFSGRQFAEFAVNTHRQHTSGNLVLDVRSDSQQTLNEWFKTKLQFSLALPASPPVPGEERPFHLEGARLVQVRGRSAAFIAYQVQNPILRTANMRNAEASLIVTPDSVALASGGMQVDFKKVSFHYATVEGYKVVTWSLRGLTYALVSEEGNGTQRSCMVCHSAMRDRDLAQTPTPLPIEKTQSIWQ
jgi:anti-sigma factor RsiW